MKTHTLWLNLIFLLALLLSGVSYSTAAATETGAMPVSRVVFPESESMTLTASTDLAQFSGSMGQESLSHMLSNNNNEWTTMESGATAWLYGVWGSSDNDVFAVGGEGTILHYDGNTWNTMHSGTNVSLNGVWGSSSTDVFAVGQSGTILRYNGNSWNSMSSGTTKTLVGIWGSSDSNIFAVGGAGEGSVILHYNGNAWREMQSSNLNGLNGVWGSEASNIFAVGENRTVLRFNGSNWTPMYSSGGAHLNSVWGSQSNDVFAVGEWGFIQHYDGIRWTEVNRGMAQYLIGIWGSGANKVFAVGGTVGSGGRILLYNGNVWSTVHTTTKWITGVWGSGPNDVFAVGEGGTILHYAGEPKPYLTYVGAQQISGGSMFFLGEIDRRITLGDHVHLQLPFRNVGNAILTNAVVTITSALPMSGSVGVEIHNGSSWGVNQQPVTLTPPTLAPGQTGIADFWIYVTNPDPDILLAAPTGTWMRLSDGNNDWKVSVLLEPIVFDIAEHRDMLASSCLHNPNDPQIQRYAQYVAGASGASSPPSSSSDPDTAEQAIHNLVDQVNTEFHYKDIWNTRQSDTVLLSTRNGDIGACRDYADLTTGLLRALGLPARYTDAVFARPRPSESDEIVGHAWVEAYLGVGDWRQADSTWGRSFDESVYETRGYRVLEAWADRHPLSSAVIWLGRQYQCIIPCYTAPIDCPTCLRESNTRRRLLPWQQPDLTCVEYVTSRYHQTQQSSKVLKTSEVWSPDERLLVNIQSPTFVTRTVPFTLNTGIVNSTTLPLSVITATVAISAHVDSQAPLFEVTPSYHVLTNISPGQALTLTWIITPLLAGSGLPLRVSAMSGDLFEFVEQPLVVNEPGTLPDLLLIAGCDQKTVQINTPFTLTASIVDEHLRVITDSLSTISATVYATPTLAFSTTFSLSYCADCQYYAYELTLPSDAPIGRYQVEYRVVRLGYESGHATSSFFVVPALMMTLVTDPLVLNMTDPMTLTAQIYDRGTALTQAGVYAEITTPGGVTAIPLFGSEGAVYTATLRPADLADSLGSPPLTGQWTIKTIGNYQGGMAVAMQSITIRHNIYLPLILRNY